MVGVGKIKVQGLDGGKNLKTPANNHAFLRCFAEVVVVVVIVRAPLFGTACRVHHAHCIVLGVCGSETLKTTRLRAILFFLKERLFLYPL